MLDFRNKILMDQAKDGDGGGAPKDPPKSDDPPKTPPNDPPAEKDGDNLDELGYEKRKPDVKEGEAPKAGDPKEKTPAKEPEKVANPVTGYGDEPEKIEEPPKAPATPPPPATELDKKLEGLHPSFAENVKKQIADLGLEGDKVDKIIAFKKAEQQAAMDWQKNAQLDADRQEKLQKAQWHKELKEDPVFGGDKFLTNVTRGEKILEQYGSEVKKELTDAKQMLRPSVMRMLSRLADDLYPDDKVAHGDPPAPEGDKGGKDEKNDPLAFYT